MRGNGLGIDSGYDNAGIGDLSRVSPVAPHHATNGRAYFLGVFQGTNDVRAYVPFQVATTYRKNKDHVGHAQATHHQPIDKYSFPSVVVHASRQFGNIVGGCVGFDARNLSEIIYSVRCMTGTAADAEKKQA